MGQASNGIPTHQKPGWHGDQAPAEPGSLPARIQQHQRHISSLEQAQTGPEAALKFRTTWCRTPRIVATGWGCVPTGSHIARTQQPWAQAGMPDTWDPGNEAARPLDIGVPWPPPARPL